MTDPIFIDVDALFAASSALRPARVSSESLPGTLLQLDRMGRDQLGALSTAAALSSFCVRWRMVYLDLSRRASALIDGLAVAGGEYARIDGGLVTAAPFPVGPRVVAFAAR